MTVRGVVRELHRLLFIWLVRLSANPIFPPYFSLQRGPMWTHICSFRAKLVFSPPCPPPILTLLHLNCYCNCRESRPSTAAALCSGVSCTVFWVSVRSVWLLTPQFSVEFSYRSGEALKSKQVIALSLLAMCQGETQMQPCCLAQQCVHENFSVTSSKAQFISKQATSTVSRGPISTHVNVWRTVFVHFTLYLCKTNCSSYMYFFGPYSVKESM